MGFITKLADFFRGGGLGTNQPLDKYGVLSPLLATIEYVETTSKYFKLFTKDHAIASLLRTKAATPNGYNDKAQQAYQLYLKNLSGHEQAMERQLPLSTISVALETILGNLELIEDNFNTLFGDAIKENTAIRSSSVVIIGYVESANRFCNWVSQLTSHLVPGEQESFTPFVTKSMLATAPLAGEFVTNNLNKWPPRYKGLLSLVTDMQKKGTDVVVCAGDTWIDGYVRDNQFSHTEQTMITAAFGNPILMWASGNIAREQAELELMTTRKEWLITKIALLESKSRGVDPLSADYKKMIHAIDYYAAQVSLHEQKIERLRA